MRRSASPLPLNENPNTAVFDLTGAREALSPIADECEWILDSAEVERVRREREEAAERARQEEFAKWVDGARLSASTLRGTGSIGSTAYARGGLPEGIAEATFPDTTTSALMRAAERGRTVICPSA